MKELHNALTAVNDQLRVILTDKLGEGGEEAAKEAFEAHEMLKDKYPLMASILSLSLTEMYNSLYGRSL